MEVSEALRLVGRLKNLPDLYDRIESAVCGLVHRYHDELFELEKAEMIDSVGFDDDRHLVRDSNGLVHFDSARLTQFKLRE